MDTYFNIILIFSGESDLNTIFGDKLIQDYHASIQSSLEDNLEEEEYLQSSIDPSNLEPEVSLEEDH